MRRGREDLLRVGALFQPWRGNPPLPLACAIGMAMGFYPRPSPFIFLAMCAFASAAFGTVLLGFGCHKAGVRGCLAMAFALGLAAGLCLARDDEGRWLFPGPGPEKAAVGSADRMCDRAPVPLGLQSVSGILAADSTPARSGFRSYLVRVDSLCQSGKAVKGELSFSGRAVEQACPLRVLLRDGPSLNAGFRITATGRLVSGPDGAAFFATASGFQVSEKAAVVDRLRSAIREACLKALRRIGDRSAGLMEALILGSKDNLDEEEAGDFKAAGCSHILALSGEHLSVLTLLTLSLLRPLIGPFRGRVAAAIAATLFMWIAGTGPSLIRAVIMAWVGTLASILDRPQDWLGVLAICFVIALPLDPLSARSLSFLLSYLAVLGLALLAPAWDFALRPWLPPPLSGAAAASLAAQAGTAPLIAFCFGTFQWIGALASIIAAPLVTLMMWWGMAAALVCSIVPAAAALATPISDSLHALLTGCMHFCASAPQLALTSFAAKTVLSLAVGALAAFVYALPHVDRLIASSRTKNSSHACL